MSGIRIAIRLQRTPQRLRPLHAIVTRATRVTDGPIWTPMAVGTTFLGRVRYGSPLSPKTTTSIRMATAVGWLFRAPATFGHRVTHGVGRRSGAGAGRTGPALVGVGPPVPDVDE